MLPDALDPSNVRRNLPLASLYLTGFEQLANSVIDRMRSFLQFGGTQRYWAEMDLGGHGVLENSCRWLVNVSALSPEEAEAIDTTRQKRNRIAHELPAILVGDKKWSSSKIWPNYEIFSCR
jgi:hypothetical protein